MWTVGGLGALDTDPRPKKGVWGPGSQDKAPRPPISRPRLPLPDMLPSLARPGLRVRQNLQQLQYEVPQTKKRSKLPDFVDVFLDAVLRVEPLGLIPVCLGHHRLGSCGSLDGNGMSFQEFTFQLSMRVL